MSELFISNLPPALEITDAVERRLLAEYGAMFVAKNVVVPNTIVFRDEVEVSEFQAQNPFSDETIGDMRMELQTAAMNALREAAIAAAQVGMSISPRGSDSARRTYHETVGLWASRVEPALDHWVSAGRLDRNKAENIRSLTPFEQVPLVLGLEEEGIFFSKDLSKSIVYSVAPPGSSQHLSMLAFDVKEHDDPGVREILARHYWYQTVISDLPHFTFLGIEEHLLGGVGLKKVSNDGRLFWVPDI